MPRGHGVEDPGGGGGGSPLTERSGLTSGHRRAAGTRTRTAPACGRAGRSEAPRTPRWAGARPGLPHPPAKPPTPSSQKMAASAPHLAQQSLCPWPPSLHDHPPATPGPILLSSALLMTHPHPILPTLTPQVTQPRGTSTLKQLSRCYSRVRQVATLGGSCVTCPGPLPTPPPALPAKKAPTPWCPWVPSSPLGPTAGGGCNFSADSPTRQS